MFKISIWDRQIFKFRWKRDCRFITETTFHSICSWFSHHQHVMITTSTILTVHRKSIQYFFNIFRIKKSIRSSLCWLKGCQCNLSNISFDEISKLPPLITLAALPWSFWHFRLQGYITILPYQAAIIKVGLNKSIIYLH